MKILQMLMAVGLALASSAAGRDRAWLDIAPGFDARMRLNTPADGRSTLRAAWPHNYPASLVRALLQDAPLPPPPAIVKA